MIGYGLVLGDPQVEYICHHPTFGDKESYSYQTIEKPSPPFPGALRKRPKRYRCARFGSIRVYGDAKGGLECWSFHG